MRRRRRAEARLSATGLEGSEPVGGKRPDTLSLGYLADDMSGSTCGKRGAAGEGLPTITYICDKVRIMAKEPKFASIGRQAGNIDVRLSYRIVELFSEGLYASPNKAIEELVANSFDAGAQRVQVLLSANLHAQDATIVVVDDGEGMDAAGLKQHWLIGVSNKRKLPNLPRGRQQIGQFGIGKLATYVLAERLTHITKRKGKYYSTSMDFAAIDQRVEREVEPKAPIKIPLRELTESEVTEALKPWTGIGDFKASKIALFGKGAPPSWTVAILSSLKPRVLEIKPGMLEWLLRTAMPLRPDFEIWLNRSKLIPSKQGKGLLKKWVLGKDLVALPRPAPKELSATEDKNAAKDSEYRFGLNVPDLGRVTGYAEAYQDLLTGGKSDEIGRSYGFFVYVRDRLLNVVDGHFGISPNELRHGTFGRFRLVIRMDSLDSILRSNREAISEGPLLETAQNLLIGIFNAVRPILEKQEEEEEPGAKLSRQLASSPGSLSRFPITQLARAVVEGKGKSRYLLVPELKSPKERASFIAELELRATEADKFVSSLIVDDDGTPESGIAQYDTATGRLLINGWHPFVATFRDDFLNKKTRQPLEIFAMAEVLAEAHLHVLGVDPEYIEDFLSMRDQLLRDLANESGHQSPFAIAQALQEARNNPDALEEKVCAAFTSLGFETKKIGGRNKPDGVALAILPPDNKGRPRQYAVSLDAKSKGKDAGTVAAGTVKTGTIIRHRDTYSCQHALVVGRAFPTSKGEASALANEIDADRNKTEALGERKTITLITIDDLAKLVRLRPLKRIRLQQLRELFECRLPDETRAWIEAIEKKRIKNPPYPRIVKAIEVLHKEWIRAPVKYSGLRIKLAGLNPAIRYETDHELRDICVALAQMSNGTMFARSDAVELDQSADNVITAIDAAMKEYPEDDNE